MCVAGNVEVDQVVDNTLRVLDAAGVADVQIGRGTAPGPGGRSVHGADGMADLGLPLSQRRAPQRSIAEALNLAAPYTLLSLAPCTDLAPVLSANMTSIVAVAGFNREHDNEAFDAVVGCGVPAVVYEHGLWQQARVTRADADLLARSLQPATSLAGRLLLHQVRRGDGETGSIGDAVAVAAIIAGTLAEPDGLACASTFLDAFRSVP